MAFRIGLQMDNVALIKRLRNGERRLAFAAVNAVNAAAREVQKAQREAIQQRATVRKREFTLREIAVIRPFASVGRGIPFAEVAIGRKARLFLSQLEEGGLKEHRGRNVAIPVTGSEARPTFQTPQAFPPLVKTLKFRRPRRKRGARPGARTILQGTEGRFLIPGEGIFRRVSDTSVWAVIVYKPEVRVPKRLGWLDRARRVGPRALREAMEREAINAVGRGS